MMFSNGIIPTERGTFVLNRFAGKELSELMNSMMENMLSDLSAITGLEKEDIIEDYINRNDWNVFDEIMKKQGKQSMKDSKSLVLRELEYQRIIWF